MTGTTAPGVRRDLVAVDWGTTSLRGYRVVDGVVTDQASSDAGVGTLRAGDFPDRLARLLHELDAASGTVLVSGMAGSAAGWTEVPCVPLPADAGTLARAVASPPRQDLGGPLAPFDVHLVPGVAHLDDGLLVDLMRGEEVEFLGAGAADGVTVLPGSHSKWLVGRDRAVVAFTTFLTGEAFVALGRHTLLARSLPADLRFGDDRLDEFVTGVDASAGDLLQRLFTVRVRSLGGADPESCAAWLSGLLVGSEVRAGLRWSGAPARLRVGGADALRRLYRRALEHLGHEVDLVPPLASARGLVEVAGRMADG